METHEFYVQECSGLIEYKVRLNCPSEIQVTKIKVGSAPTPGVLAKLPPCLALVSTWAREITPVSGRHDLYA